MQLSTGCECSSHASKCASPRRKTRAGHGRGGYCAGGQCPAATKRKCRIHTARTRDCQRGTTVSRRRGRVPCQREAEKCPQAVMAFADICRRYNFIQRRETAQSLKAASVSGLTWCSIPSASISATCSGMPSERRKATTVSCRLLHMAAKARPFSVRKMAR
jgi:hypothetical protein